MSKLFSNISIHFKAPSSSEVFCWGVWFRGCPFWLGAKCSGESLQYSYLFPTIFLFIFSLVWQVSDRLESEVKSLIKVALFFPLKLQSSSFIEPSDLLDADNIWSQFPPYSAGAWQQLALRLVPMIEGVTDSKAKQSCPCECPLEADCELIWLSLMENTNPSSFLYLHSYDTRKVLLHKIL